MKKLLFIILVAFAAVACQKEDGSIYGTASADDGNVVSGITVKIYTEDAQLYSQTTTDNTGNFRFDGLESGNYYIGATITINDDVWDTGNKPQIFFVGDEIDKFVELKLTKKS